jgi:UDP-N-acetyl-L-fucosamine synthase
VKVLTVIGTRPEIVRLSRVIARLDETVDHVLVHTGQNYDYELNRVFFEDMQIRAPDHFLQTPGDSVAETIGNIIARVDRVLEQAVPDAFLVLGDTNSCLSAIAAKRRQIPVFHMEAGNRCFDERVPEETNRRIVDHVADVNMPYSAIARDYLLREGLPADRIVKTGSPMKEVLDHHAVGIDASMVLEQLGLKPQSYVVVSCHREENVDEPIHLGQLVTLLDRVAERYGLPVAVSTHPRTRARIDELGATLNPLVAMHRPLGFTDYVRLQRDALVTLSDSGTITEESSIVGFPAVNIREAHERPEGMEEAAVIMAGLDPSRVLDAIEITLAQHRRGFRAHLPLDYDVPDVSNKVVRIIASYTDYVNRNVWHKSPSPALESSPPDAHR